ncbi:MAG: diguanylate cyclase [Alteraurantiacibacter sp. bin_em_oilr2.035]|nr:diguanylate cyclase [Alteraurantiacibacter sp. bin_em_oilr2.035]
MRLLKDWRDPLLAGVLWSIIATGTLALRNDMGAVVLIWFPIGIAVAAFHSISQRHWPKLIAVLFIAHVLTIGVYSGDIARTIAYATSNIMEAAVCAVINVRVLGSRTAVPRRLRHVIGLFGAAAASCLVGAIIAAPFESQIGSVNFARWFMSGMLSILIVTPLSLKLRAVVKRTLSGKRFILDRELVLALAACAALAIIALQVERVTLMPLLIAAMVAMAVRYGHSAIAMTMLTYTAVAMVFSIGGDSPAPFLKADIPQATQVLQSWMLTLLATALPVSAVLLKRDEMQAELVHANADLHDNLMLLNLAEQLTGLGRWRLDLVTREQHWSKRMYRLCNMPVDLPSDPGDVRSYLPEDGEGLFSQYRLHKKTRDPYSFDYIIPLDNGAERVLRLSVLNEFDDDGRRIAIFVVAMDVTEQIEREQALDFERGQAVRSAAEAHKLANTDSLTGLLNRRSTFARLDAMLDVAQSCNSPLSAIMFDIDHFKNVNDTYGHQTGDAVIRQIAELARKQARQGDLVGRIGGEEFVWLLPQLDVAHARKLAERLRQAVEVGVQGSSLPKVTISVGLAHYRWGDSQSELLERADRALYEAKKGGRNTVRRAA